MRPPHIVSICIACLTAVGGCDAVVPSDAAVAIDAGVDAGETEDAPRATGDAPVGPDAAEPPIDAGPFPFAVGLSQFRSGTADDARSLGARWLRPTLQWRFLQASTAVEGLTPDDVRDAAVISAWAAARDWSGSDAVLQDCVASGAQLLPSVGTGWRRAMPLVGTDPASPTTLGEDEYLAQMYRVVRATVERYDGDGMDDVPSGLRVGVWQVENELNEALVTAVGGERHPSGTTALSSPWSHFEFLTRLLETLIGAVHDADPSARVLTNLHTSIHPNIDRALSVTTWDEALVRWRGVLDWVGLDVYPNIDRAEPVAPEVVADTVTRALPIANGRPVLVIETGYPTGPAELGFDEARQVVYLRDAFAQVRAAGGAGVFWYGTRTTETSDPLSAEDVTLHEAIAAANHDGDTAALLGILSREDPARVARVEGAVQGYWGLYRSDGSEKPAAATFRSVASAP